jgi:hypothetical protein
MEYRNTQKTNKIYIFKNTILHDHYSTTSNVFSFILMTHISVSGLADASHDSMTDKAALKNASIFIAA